MCATYTERDELKVSGYKYQGAPSVIFIVTEIMLMMACVVIRRQNSMHGFSQVLPEIVRISQDFYKIQFLKIELFSLPKFITSEGEWGNPCGNL